VVESVQESNVMPLGLHHSVKLCQNGVGNVQMSSLVPRGSA